jgi:hypothetical protein
VFGLALDNFVRDMAHFPKGQKTMNGRTGMMFIVIVTSLCFVIYLIKKKK